MPVRAKSLSDPVEPADGTRVLIARYQPRATARAARTWSMWDKRLAPSQALFDAYRGRERAGGRVVARGLPGIPWEEYVLARSLVPGLTMPTPETPEHDLFAGLRAETSTMTRSA